MRNSWIHDLLLIRIQQGDAIHRFLFNGADFGAQGVTGRPALVLVFVNDPEVLGNQGIEDRPESFSSVPALNRDDG
jgi:hypothetical protein